MTIIVLLILAGITISLVIGQNGIITRANEAKLKNENGTVFEYLVQAILAEQIEQRGESFDISAYLQNNGYMDENSVLNVEKTVGKKLNYGNGTTNDIYIIKTDGLYYVDKDGNENLIGNIEIGEKVLPTPDDYFDFDPATGTIALKDSKRYYGTEIDFPIDTIVIPSQIDGVKVTTIANNGMAACNLKSIIIPNTIKEIKMYAFYGCKKLEEISIPDSVTTIGEHAFYECMEMKKVKLSNNLESLESFIFRGCEGLTSITIPNSVKIIKNRAFYNCIGLSELIISSSVETIEYQAFSGCSNLANVTIPDTIKHIDSSAFEYTLWENSLPEGPFYIGNILYKYKGSVPSDFIVKEGTKIIAGDVFYNKGFTTITLPNSLEKIESNAFQNCSNLTTINLPNSLKEIEGGTFRGCKSLETISGGDSLEKIGDDMAFQDTKWLQNKPDGEVYIGKVLYTYKGTAPTNTNIIVREGTKSITYRAFKEQVNITNIALPDSIVEIGWGAFYNCRGITNITIPKLVTIIDSSAFGGWTSNQTICVPWKEGNKPSGWNNWWDSGCNAFIQYQK